MVPQRYQSGEGDVSRLGQPLKFEFSGRTAPNRFLKAAMTERLSSWSPTDFESRGIPSKNLINVYRRWGEGDFGVILTGNIMVSEIYVPIEYDHLEAAGNLIIPPNSPFEGERFEAFREMGAQAKKNGALIVGQVSHPGRQVSETIQKHPISASDVQLEGNIMGMTFAKPRAATTEDIAHVIDGFAHAAEYMEKAGYDGIELHGAHGYLLAQFISETTNKRIDKYGGSLENRARIILEVAQEVRKRTKPSFIVGIKLNSVEFQEGGFKPEEAHKLVKLLENNSFDFVELSGGTYEQLAFVHQRESTKQRESFFIEFAEKIVPGLTKTKSYVTGGFRTVGAMAKALDVCDGVGLGRPVTQEFDLPKLMLNGDVKGAIEQKLDPSNFGLTNVAAGTQIRQVGKDQNPVDLSKAENVDGFMEDMQKWSEKMGNDKEGKEYGFIDLTLQASPYGATSA